VSAPRGFGDRLQAAIDAKGSCLIVGIDPVLGKLPPEFCSAGSLSAWTDELVHSVAPFAVGIKPNTAFFERFGTDGWDALDATCRAAREAGLIVIVDAKRGDLESTAEAYADALLGETSQVGQWADAVTVNPYLGTDGLKPFLATAGKLGKGLFVLVRTSNPSAVELQDVLDREGKPFYLRVAGLVDRWGTDLVGESGLSAVGAVVGATAPRQAAEVRAALPRTPFLVPGYGAQGAGAEEIRPHFLAGGRGVVVNSSRGIIYAHQKDAGRPWQEAAARAAERARDDLERVRLTC
jgi:orotidine-5'-phosphate decarboxylase